MIVLFILYAIIVIGISLWYRKHSSGEEYLMGNRKATAILVASALFTLVGGGELVTLTSLSFTFGYAGIALFIGYALGFCFLGIIAPRIRKGSSEHLYLSLPDYVYKNYGRLTGILVFLISFGAFFSLLLIQFTAGGQILNSLTGWSYNTSIFITAGVCTTYLLIGGFKTVLATDLIQGIARLILMPILVFVAAKELSSPISHVSETLPLNFWLSLIITGFFSASASADVWQRIFAAKSNSSARNGLFGGALLLMLFGITLVALGLIARSSGSISNPDSAFTTALTTMLPHNASVVAVVLVLSVIMSTADTEIFLLSGMTLKEINRFQNKNFTDGSYKKSIFATRVLMIIITISAVGLSLVFKELVAIYTWLLCTLLVMSPMILFSLFVGDRPIAARVSLLLNLIIFIILAIKGILTPENAYFIVIPGALTYLITYAVSKKITT